MGRKQSKDQRCYCGSGKVYSRCCQLYISGQSLPETAEQLMRSRYSAYVLNDEEYLLRTWHQSTRPVQIDLMTNRLNWFRLKVVSTEAGGSSDRQGVVEFVAFHKINGKAHKQHERSRFLKEGEQWLYVGGDVSQ